MNHIALDGPRNGDYLNPQQAATNGYELIEWAEGEQAYLHTATDAPLTEDDIPADVMDEIEATL